MSDIENPSAFPHEAFNEWVGRKESGDGPLCQHTPNSAGMTLRDYFAGQAIAGSDFMNCTGWTHLELARNAYSLADAMLAARKGAAA